MVSNIKIKVFKLSLIALFFHASTVAAQDVVKLEKLEILKLKEELKAELDKFKIEEEKLSIDLEKNFDVRELLASLESLDFSPPAPPAPPSAMSPVVPLAPIAPDVDESIVSQSDCALTEKSKVIRKSYTVDKNDKLSINNQYGNVNVVTWAKNEIRVQVEVKAFEFTEARAQDLLDNVNIDEDREDNLIAFRTNIDRESQRGNAWRRTANGAEAQRGVQVNYTISMPAKNALAITNKYGDINIADFSGAATLNCSFGSLKAGALSNPDNKVQVSYGVADIEKLNSTALTVSYGSVELGSADKLNAIISYSTGKINKLSGSSEVKLKYSSNFKITDVNPRNLNLDAAYSTVSLGFDPAASFDFDVTVSYAEFNSRNKLNILTKSPAENERGFNPTKNYKGRIGKVSDSNVTVNVKYGSIKFL